MSTSARKGALRWLFVTLLVVVIDQVTKAAARTYLSPAEPLPILGDSLRLTLIHNSGVSFGLLSGMRFGVIAFSVVTLALIIYFMVFRPPQSRIMMAAIAVAGGGVAGNFIDRLASGRVTDFLDVRIWPVFNVADIAISLGAVTMIVCILLTGRLEGELRRERHK